MNKNNNILITGITQNATAITLIPARPITLTNLTNTGNYRLRLACGLKATSALPVQIQVGAVNVPVLSNYGNLVYSNQLKTRKCYRIGYGNGNTGYTNGQFVVFDCICPGTVTISA